MREYRCRKGRRMGSRRFETGDQGMRGRPLKEIVLDDFPKIKEIIPNPKLSEEEIFLTFAEYEAMRLVDLEGLNQDMAGNLMEVSRGTIWRLLSSGRTKLMQVLTKGQKLVIGKEELFEE